MMRHMELDFNSLYDENSQIIPGSLLISSPFMLDPDFRHSVVFLTEYSKETGAVGFVLNRPMKVQMQEVLPDFPEVNTKLFYGGPVKRDSLHYIHDLGHLIEQSTEICDGIFYGGNFEQIQDLLHNGSIKPENLRFFAGYSGWSAKQLEEETYEKSWFVKPASYSEVYSSPNNMWRNILKGMGKDFNVIANFPLDPRMN